MSKEIHCQNKSCRRLLARIDGERLVPVGHRVLSDKISDKRKKFNPLYCVHCHQTTRVYKHKFQSKIKKPEKFSSSRRTPREKSD